MSISMQQQQAYGATLLRAGLGIMLLAHSLLKVNTFTVAGTIGFFESVGIPFAALAAYQCH